MNNLTNLTTVKDVLPGFADYMQVERQFSPATREKYLDGVRWFLRDVGDLPVRDIGLRQFISLKARMVQRGAGESRIAGVIFGLKSLLRYARDVLKIPVLDLQQVRAPRATRREVVYLTSEELETFLQGIRLQNSVGEPRLAGLWFRALVETLAATAMRISEALSLDRYSINREHLRATIIGKGNKERAVFFTERALVWIDRYLALRSDRSPVLFANKSGGRLTVNAVEDMFRKHGRLVGMEKRVTPHIIRHTTATNLLRNGCPLGFIKEILGHDRLETTCRFYLGILDKAEAQKAHRLYMSLGSSQPVPGRGRAESLSSTVPRVPGVVP